MTSLSVPYSLASSATASGSLSRLPRSVCRLMTDKSASRMRFFQFRFPPLPVGIPAARVISRTIREEG